MQTKTRLLFDTRTLLTHRVRDHGDGLMPVRPGRKVVQQVGQGRRDGGVVLTRDQNEAASITLKKN